MTKIIIFISGRGSNMEALLEAAQDGILKGIVETKLVFTNNPEAQGLGIAAKYGVPTASIYSKGKNRAFFDREVLNLLHDYNFDYIILAGYMRVLSGEFIRAYPGKIINIHPADTTKHQGLHAYEWAFNQHLTETKITVHYVNEGVDTGSIIAQKTVDLQHVKTLIEVEKRGLAVEHQFYAATLCDLFLHGNDVHTK